MARRHRPDIAVVGGGVVGATCALALARLGLDVVLVEGSEPPRWSPGPPDRRDLRVYAFAPDNVALLDGLDVWSAVLSRPGQSLPRDDAVIRPSAPSTNSGQAELRAGQAQNLPPTRSGDERFSDVQAYRRMRVWDAAGGGELTFDADAFGRRELGWIVEHALLATRLWEALPRAGIDVRMARVEGFEQDATSVVLRLDDGARMETRLAIAADGADSTLRTLAGLDVEAHDYAQRGVVAYVSTTLPHAATAWQRFLPGGPLAFLPCADGSSSIVWTLPEEQARRVLALDETTFARELTSAFAARLGIVEVLSRRAAFPLRRQLAQSYVADRVLVLGDAAHVVHPLAGQGVNLGLRDVAALRDVIDAAQRRNVDWAAPQRLARWARVRKSDNAIAAFAFDGINRLFSTDDMVSTLLRGPSLGIAGKLRPITNMLWRRAAGL